MKQPTKGRKMKTKTSMTKVIKAHMHYAKSAFDRDPGAMLDAVLTTPHPGNPVVGDTSYENVVKVIYAAYVMYLKQQLNKKVKVMTDTKNTIYSK